METRFEKHQMHEALTITIQRQLQIVYALMMHDIKSRFFGNGFGYLAMMAWPMSHIVVVIVMFAASGRVVPYGNSLILYAATGVIPFVASSYISKFIILGVLTNRSFLGYPIVKVIDLITARAGLEVINLILVTVATCVVISSSGIDCWPNNPLQASEAFICSVFLGLGLGYLNGVITMIIPLWNIVFTILSIIAYAASGVVLNLEGLPVELQYYASFNPFAQGVVWMRSAFFGHFESHILDKVYFLEWGVGTLACGLVGERLLRGVVLTPR